MTESSRDLVDELVTSGLDRREAKWLVEEFHEREEPNSRDEVLRAAQRRRSGEPLQYVIGHWPFRSLELTVDPRVLIPRPETEELVTIALGVVACGRELTVLDLGCGSGAIGLSLVSELREKGEAARLVALDSSHDALEVAAMNAVACGVHDVEFVASSWFDALDPRRRGSFGVIVANPPYVGVDEFNTLDPVLRHEPRGALVALDVDGVAGFSDLRHIIALAREWLEPGACLVCEHAEHQGETARDLATASGFVDVSTVQDLAGRDRFLVARRPR